jgi:hypothetical protein
MTPCILVDVTNPSDLPHDFIFKLKDWETYKNCFTLKVAAVASVEALVTLCLNTRRHMWQHRNLILVYIQQDATLHGLFYLETALHVSGGISTHHQERIQLYLQHLVFVTPLLLSAAIVEELELVWVCCGWRTSRGVLPIGVCLMSLIAKPRKGRSWQKKFGSKRHCKKIVKNSVVLPRLWWSVYVFGNVDV